MRDVAIVVVVTSCGIGALCCRWFRVAPRLWVALTVGAVVRILVAALARPITPPDVAQSFAVIGREVIAGRDPALSLPGHLWNFLPLMPYLWALVLKTGVAWATFMKVIPIASDLVNIWLVGLLCERRRRRRAVRIAYALNPLAIVIVGVHGQVEPTSLMFILAGLVLYQRKRGLPAGVFFGLAIATKTWPILVVLPVLAASPRRMMRPVFGIIAVTGSLALSSVVLLGSAPLELLAKITSYSSFSGYWGWAGSLVSFGHRQALGYDSSVSGISTLFIAVAIITTLVAYQKTNALRRGWTTAMATLVVAAGFGPQYLMWPVPLLAADSERRGDFYLIAGTTYALAAYLPLFPGGNLSGQQYLAGISWLVIAAMVALLIGAAQRDRPRVLLPKTLERSDDNRMAVPVG